LRPHDGTEGYRQAEAPAVPTPGGVRHRLRHTVRRPHVAGIDGYQV